MVEYDQPPFIYKPFIDIGPCKEGVPQPTHPDVLRGPKTKTTEVTTGPKHGIFFQVAHLPIKRPIARRVGLVERWMTIVQSWHLFVFFLKRWWGGCIIVIVGYIGIYIYI